MTKLASFALLLFVSPFLHAQLTGLPPPSAEDGILIIPNQYNPSAATWASTALWNYRNGDGNDFHAPAPGSADQFGQVWTSWAPSKDGLTALGGTLQAIFLGAGGSWIDALGYSFSRSASFALSSLNDPTSPVPPSKLGFGDSVTLPFAAGEASAFELWISNAGKRLDLFSSASSAAEGALSIEWTHAPLLIPSSALATSIDDSASLPTWIVNISDGSDSFRFALQSGRLSAVALEPVPEPQTYGLCAATLLLGVIWYRRFR